MTSVERRPLLDSYVRQRTLYPHLRQLVRPDASNGPLTSYCLVSGIVSAAALDASGTFVGLQTANVLREPLSFACELALTVSPQN